MKTIGWIVVTVSLLTGCTRKDVAASFLAEQDLRYDHYLRGSLPEAKQAVREMISAVESHREELKGKYRMEWDLTLCYARLAMIAEVEKDEAEAAALWNHAIDHCVRELKESKKKQEKPQIDDIRKFVLALENNTSTPVEWKKHASTLLK
jgi:hypothetical protein